MDVQFPQFPQLGDVDQPGLNYQAPGYVERSQLRIAAQGLHPSVSHFRLGKIQFPQAGVSLQKRNALIGYFCL